MYDYDRTKTASGSYDRIMQKLVRVVDKVTEPSKHHNMAKRMADDVYNLASADSELDKKYLYGIQQRTDEFKEAVDRVRQATEDLEWEYDELNKQLLRLKRK